MRKSRIDQSNMSMLDQNKMTSASAGVQGFDIGGGTKSYGSFYSSLRERTETSGQRQKTEPNFYNTEKMRGKDFVKSLIKQ